MCVCVCVCVCMCVCVCVCVGVCLQGREYFRVNTHFLDSPCGQKKIKETLPNVNKDSSEGETILLEYTSFQEKTIIIL